MLDVLFLHTPKFQNYYRPIGQYTFVLYPPMGIFGLADYLRQNHHTTKIIHLGVEQLVQGALDIPRILHEEQPAIVGMDLHWHFQSYDVIETARKIKQAAPNLPILLGGFTASLFAEEILREFPFVDFVIRGDAEIPLIQLVAHFQSDKNYASVPNLAYRDHAGVVLNPISYVADSAMLDRLCFTDLTLLKDHPYFVKFFSRYMHMPELSEPFQKRLFGFEKGFQVYIGRGCVHECSYCGGSRESQVLINSRKQVAVRSVDSILRSIDDLARFGFDSACLALDSFPIAKADDYYIPIFEALKSRNIPLEIEVERYFLPSVRFLDSFCGLPANSFVTLSPHTHSEELRRRNGLYRFSNEALERCLDLMEEKHVHSLVCFTCGLPFETREDLESMAEYQRKLRKKYKQLRFKTCMIEIEPGSPMSRKADFFGLNLNRTTFLDYYRYHGQPGRNHWLEMGYSRSGCPDHAEVSDFFCHHFCERFKAGRASPIICNALGAMWKMKVFKAIDKVLPIRD